MQLAIPSSLLVCLLALPDAPEHLGHGGGGFGHGGFGHGGFGFRHGGFGHGGFGGVGPLLPPMGFPMPPPPMPPMPLPMPLPGAGPGIPGPLIPNDPSIVQDPSLANGQQFASGATLVQPGSVIITQQPGYQVSTGMSSTLSGLSGVVSQPMVVQSQQPLMQPQVVMQSAQIARLDQQPGNSDGLQITVDGQGQPPMPPTQAPPMQAPPQQQPPMPDMPQQPMPVQSSGSPMTVKGFNRKTESYSETKTGSRTTTEEYQMMGNWDNPDYAARNGRFDGGRLVFAPLQTPVSVEVPVQQQSLVGPSSVGYQGQCSFYSQGKQAGTCGYVPNVTNYVSLPMSYMPNACNRCVAIRSGNTFVKALVVEGSPMLPPKGLNLSTDLCSSLGVSPSSQLKVDWDFIPC